MWGVLQGNTPLIGTLREDNAAAIRDMESGKNPTMQLLHRVHGVSISSLFEILIPISERRVSHIVWTKSEEMRADIYTQVFHVRPRFNMLYS